MTWRRVPLAEVADFSLGKMLDANKNRGVDRPYLANVNVRWGEFELDDLRTMRFEESESERFGVKNDDILMCEGGEPGRCAIWREQLPGMMYQKALHRIRAKNSTDARFLYYTFLKMGRTGEFAQYFTGATIKHLPKEKLALVRVPLPEKAVQQRIGDILAAYDDLIQNNRRRIKLLEEAARLIYREWFVRLRFPGYENTKIVNGIPQGWGRKPISDVSQTVGGGTPSTKNSAFWDGGDIPWVVPSDVTKNGYLYLPDPERFITPAGLSASSAQMVPANTILMTSRASVGFFALMDKPVCTNQGFINVIPHQPNMLMFLLYCLQARVEEIRSRAGGSTYPEISKSKFREMTVLVPSDSVLNEFELTMNPVFSQMRCLILQIRALTRARDLLLPRLMSGEVEV